MGFYSRVIFPRLCEFGLNRPFVAALRRAALATADGTILEIGIGTGLNLPEYPAHVRKITAIDPNPAMHKRARARSEQSGIEVDSRVLSSERLPFDDGAFDCVVSTFTLCSIAQVDRALAEIHRVLKPGGRFLFLEHGLSPDPKISRWQHRLNGLQRLLADNCHLDRNIPKLIQQQPHQSVQMDAFYLEQTPKTHGYIFKGVAIK
jgi:ubiquinone/menaquinone biosynthesis C-methylase UbiE